MRHLKKFEGLSDPYYIEVSPQEWYDFQPSLMEPKTISRIKSKCLLPLKDDICGPDTSGDRYTRLNFEKRKVCKVTDQVLKQTLIDIFEHGEEYFYVKYREYDWYKRIDNMILVRCDQFTGLFQFFKDKKIYKS